MTTKTTPLDDIPLNVMEVFAMAIFPSGCELYFPVSSFEDNVIKDKQAEMQTYLNLNFPFEPALA
jgi:hypothetical protein